MTLRIYRRVSTNLQDLDAQNNGIDNYLKAHNILPGTYTVYDEIGISGTIADRPVYQKLLTEVKTGDTVLVYEFSRLWRDMEEQSRATKMFLNQGITILSVTEGSVSTFEEALKADIVGVMNQYEARRVKKRSKEGIEALQAKVRKGEAVWNGRGKDKRKRSSEGYIKEQARRRALRNG